MRFAFHTLDVFTDRAFGGNPLAVLPDARGLSDAQMQRIAGEFNLSETVFVFPPASGGTRRVRIFTPRVEVPFAGHPTVGTAFLLAAIGAVPFTDGAARVVLEENVGLVPVAVRGREGAPEFAQFTAAKRPEMGPAPPSHAELAALLGLEASDLLDGALAPATFSCGLPFVFVPVRDRAAVGRARPDVARWHAVFAGAWASHTFVFAMDPERPGSDVRARMFAPDAGVLEDPATGSAAAALAGMLGLRLADRDGTHRWTIEQGFEMGRPSLIHIEADRAAGAITAVRVGGGAVPVSVGSIEVPAED